MLNFCHFSQLGVIIFPNENGSFDKKNMTELHVFGDPLNLQQNITLIE
jgi:hypothetical protein